MDVDQMADEASAAKKELNLMFSGLRSFDVNEIFS